MSEPEQRYRDIFWSAISAAGSGGYDAGALIIQRAFEERERKLREALKAVEEEGLRNHNTRCRPWWNQVRHALKDTTHD